jgi:hypothetical protein
MSIRISNRVAGYAHIAASIVVNPIPRSRGYTIRRYDILNVVEMIGRYPDIIADPVAGTSHRDSHSDIANLEIMEPRSGEIHSVRPARERMSVSFEPSGAFERHAGNFEIVIRACELEDERRRRGSSNDRSPLTGPDDPHASLVFYSKREASDVVGARRNDYLRSGARTRDRRPEITD